MIDTLANLLIFFFWFRLWNNDTEKANSYNPYFHAVYKISDSFVRFFKPVFFNTHTSIISIAAFLFLIFFRATAIPASTQWQMSIGFYNARINAALFRDAIIASFISFGLFLFYIWTISLVYLRDSTSSRTHHTSETIFLIAKPFSQIPMMIRPFILLIFGILLTAALFFLNDSINLHAGSMFAITCRYCLNSLAGMLNVCLIINQCVILFIIASWAGSLAYSPQLLLLSRDWLDFFLGPLRRYRVHLGPLDITPIIFFFSITAVYTLLMSMLYKAYHSIPI